jgi:histidine triad (HIT) family protein
MKVCVFCRIVAGMVEASVVHEDDAILAFMDLRQPNPGHVLVIPKRHVETVYDLGPDTAARLFQAAVAVAQALRRSLDPPGLNLWQSNGEDAGQEVPHVHLHLLPRYPGAGLLRIYPERPAHPSREELDGLASLLRTGLIDAH